MAITDIYGNREKRYVVIKHPDNSSVKYCYCFETQVDKTEVTDLGQTPINADTNFPNPAIAGTRNVYPPRMYKASSGISSLCSSEHVAQARQQGWGRAGKGKFPQPRSQSTETTGFTETTRGAVIVYVECPSEGGSIKYAWYMQKKQIAKIGNDLPLLGITLPSTDADWQGLVFGSDLPRPPRASKVVAATETDKGDTISVFYDSTITLPDGWIHSEDLVPFSSYYA